MLTASITELTQPDRGNSRKPFAGESRGVFALLAQVYARARGHGWLFLLLEWED